MRLVTFAVDSDPQVGVVVGDRVHALDDLIPDPPTTMLELLAAGGALLSSLRTVVAGTSSDHGASLADATLLAPIPRPGKIVAVGRNYREHADEEGAAIVADPVLFTKYPSAVVGDGADITWRAEDAGQVDYEAELAVVIGEPARDVPTERALDIVAGYTCLDDVSARDLQVARRAVGAGEEPRHVLSDRAMARDTRRVARPHRPDDRMPRQRRAAPAGVDEQHDPWRGRPDCLLLPLLHPRARRRDRDRDTGRSRGLPASTAVPRRRRRGGSHHLGHRHASQSLPGRPRLMTRRHDVIRLAYGTDGLDVEVPRDATVIRPRHRAAAADPAALLRESLERPVAGPPLRAILRRGATRRDFGVRRHAPAAAAPHARRACRGLRRRRSPTTT